MEKRREEKRKIIIVRSQYITRKGDIKGNFPFDGNPYICGKVQRVEERVHDTGYN